MSRLRGILQFEETAKEQSLRPMNPSERTKYKPENVYLGLYHFSASSSASRRAALRTGMLAMLRASLKLIEDQGIDPKSCKNELRTIVCLDQTQAVYFSKWGPGDSICTLCHARWLTECRAPHIALSQCMLLLPCSYAQSHT